jgi:hypothetical protein
MADPATSPSQFDLQRKRAAQQVNSDVQGQKDALQRRAAQLGGGVNGALIKQDQIAQDEGAKRLDQANEGINVAETAENARKAETDRMFELQKRGVALQEAGITGSYNGQDTEARRQFLASKSLQEAGLTGNYNGQATMQKAIADRQQALAEAGLTGKYNGQDTLAGQTLAHTTAQDDREFAENVKNNAIASIINLKNSGLAEDKIVDILSKMGIYYDKNGNPQFSNAQGMSSGTVDEITGRADRVKMQNEMPWNYNPDSPYNNRL